ncbi:MAG: protein kinase [Candidatus Krumholzibacteriia bacterium]|nr:protein kinase [bacterium]MCB9516061.1 protein kinase [Candidatus Latescibacterota bacterium]
MIGRSLSHYRILEALGAGGMGEVYRAEDTRLRRQVAIKLLPEGLAADAAALARFEQEARAVAALSHPNILAIFELGRDADLTFVVTELLEGETLRALLAREGALPPARASAIARDVAAGLAASHARGIVHRDLKPENVFVTAAGAKILDFGLAKVQLAPTDDDSTQSAHTRPGALVGTPAYMAPEQLRGEAVGAAADLFAFGVMLQEMLTGAHPFRGASLPETTSAILRDAPPAPAPSLPAGLRRILASCLDKSAARRALDAAAILDLLAQAPTAEAEALDSLAVLPFVNESDDEDAEYLSEGIADTLIDNLCRLPGLRVMASSTVLRASRAGGDLRELGQSLGVRAVLAGRLRRHRDRLIVRTELVDARDGTRLWGAHYQRPAADLLAIEHEIAREIGENLRLELSREQRARLARGHTENAEAHEAYLQGRFVWNRWKTADGMKTAIGFFEKALALDPLYARAFAGLADSYSVLGNVKALPPEQAYPRAKSAAEQGLAVDPELAELHTSLGFIHRHWDWDWDAAAASYERAIAANPDYATAHRWYALLLTGLARHDAALPLIHRARELEPSSVILRTSVGDVYFYARRYEEAMEHYRAAIAMDAESLAGHTDLARALELSGRYEEAIAEYTRGRVIAAGAAPDPSSGLAHVYARMGRRDDALAILEQLLAMRAERYISPYGIGSIYASLGEVETALDWLERAFDEHDQTLVLLKVHPRLDPLHGHPRYAALLARMRLDRC